MNLRLLLCIGMGLFVTYIGIFMLVTQLRSKPQPSRPAPPNFSSRESVVIDEQSGEKTIYREITVSTKFAPGPSTPPPEKLIVPEVKLNEEIVLPP